MISILILLSTYVFAEPAKDSSSFKKSLVWKTDKSLMSPIWVVNNPDLSIHFRHLNRGNADDSVIEQIKPERDNGAEVKLDENTE
jgi:hypothetical protein